MMYLFLSLQFLVLKLITNIRLEETEENKGSDYTEHGIPCSVDNENVQPLNKTYGSSLNKSPLVLYAESS